MDWFAVVSMGAYVDPASTDTEWAALFSTYGLLSVVPNVVAPNENIMHRVMRSVLKSVLRSVYGEE
jgi:hypothetical protein